MATSLTKQAEKDAREWTQAKLAYGEGAGNRRKIINETVAYKMQNIPGYEDAFAAAADHQDVPAMAKHAKRDNRRKTVNQAIVRNTKAAASGKYENLNTALLIIGGATVVLHKTGYDQKIIAAGKRKYSELRRRFRKTSMPKPSAQSKSKTDDVVWDITSKR